MEEFFAKLSNSFKTLPIFGKSSIVEIQLGFKYTSVIQPTWTEETVNWLQSYKVKNQFSKWQKGLAKLIRHTKELL